MFVSGKGGDDYSLWRERFMIISLLIHSVKQVGDELNLLNGRAGREQ